MRGILYLLQEILLLVQNLFWVVLGIIFRYSLCDLSLIIAVWPFYCEIIVRRGQHLEYREAFLCWLGQNSHDWPIIFEDA